MLPKELGNLLAAVSQSSETNIDVTRLRDELNGLAMFHQTMINDKWLNGEQRDLFDRHVGRWGFGPKVGITAKPDGPAVVHLQITSPTSGPPTVILSGASATFNCPHCSKTIKVGK